MERDSKGIEEVVKKHEKLEKRKNKLMKKKRKELRIKKLRYQRLKENVKQNRLLQKETINKTIQRRK